MVKIAVIDYDMGNLHSVCKALERVGAQPWVTDQGTDLIQAQGVVLPGVGAFDPAMANLTSRGLVEPIRQVTAQGKPFLGICLGLQLLFEGSEEGQSPGLGILRGHVRRFPQEAGLAIPHMGWNQLEVLPDQGPLWRNLPAAPWVYFVHSYYVEPQDPGVRSALVKYGQHLVTAAVSQGPLSAVQFHPEKSSRVGLQILANFVSHIPQVCPKPCA